MNKNLTWAAYGSPALPLAALTMPVYIFLPTFYAQDLGLSLALVGAVLMIARFFDVLSDPVIGHLSDKTRSRYGRRRPWIALSTVPLMAGTWFLLVPGEAVSWFYLFVWSVIVYVSWSAFLLPLNAWGAEMSRDYHERTAISAWREGFTVAGILGALALVALFGAADQEGKALFLIAVAVLVLTPLTVALALWIAPEPQVRLARRISWQEGVKVLTANRPFRRLIVAYLLNGLANGLPATLFLLFVEFGLGMKDEAGSLLFIYFLCGVLAVPLWTKLSQRFGKHKTWCGAMIWACAFFLLVPFVGEGDYTLFLLITVTTGLSVGADLALPASVQADVVDVDTQKTGSQRTGLYFALWSMATKLSLALAAGIAFPVLEFSGFSAESGGNITALIVLYSIIPVGLKILAIALMWQFPLDEQILKQTQKEIDQEWSAGTSGS